VEDAEPLAHRKRYVQERARDHRAKPDDEQAALRELQDIVEGRGSFRVYESEEDHSGLAPGVSFQLLDELRHGRFAFRRYIDLHGLSRDQARASLQGFITGARRDDERCVLVITGRGRKSPGGLSVLREALPRWLSRAPLRAHVLAYCTARAEDGGPGAFYVLLRRAGVRPFGGPA
jgi:DNA-nicking Smr family endonuclease